MSFVLPLRSIGRHGAGRLSTPGLNFRLSSRNLVKEAIRQPNAVATTYQTFGSSFSSRGVAWAAAPLTLIAGLALSSLNSKPIHMESVDTSAPFSSTTSDSRFPAPADLPKSDLNVYNLGFGTVCGICSGIFIKKGAKFIAFLLGGGFVLLQVSETRE